MVLINVTESDLSNDAPWYELVTWKKDMWYVMFLVVAILGLIGNLAITWIVWAHRSMKTITNVFIGNMGIGGLLMTLFAFPFVFQYKAYSSFWKAPGFCVVHEFATTTGVCVFVLSLMLMSIERYYTIKLPDEDMPSIRFRITIKIWFYSFIIAIPNWFFATLVTNTVSPNESVRFCHKEWPDYLGGDNSRKIYSFFLALATYFIPVGVMVYHNAKLGLHLWSHRSADLNAADKGSQRETVTMMIVQVIVFAILWFPYRVSSLILGESSMSLAIRSLDLFTSFYWIAMTSIVFYPIIYVSMEHRFQKKLKKAFQWCPCVDYESKKVNYVLGKAGQSIIIEETYRPISDV